MGGTAIAILIMLISSLVYAFAFVFQHKGTQAAYAKGDATGKSGVRTMLTNPIWCTGVFLMLVAFVLHLAALAFGSVSVVQPLIVTELIFIPPIAYLVSKTRVSAKQWVAIVVVAGSLAGFLIIAEPSEGSTVPSATAWTLLIVGSAIVVAAMIFIGEKLPLKGRAALCGIAAGCVNALLAMVAKGAFEGGNVWTNPLFYVMIITALATLATTAIAFKRGPITISSPSMIAINPVLSVVLAIVFFGDTINSSPLAIAAIIICCVLVGIGIVVLTQAEADLEAEHGETLVAIEGEVITDVATAAHKHEHKEPQP